MQFSGKTLITKENAYMILKAFAKEYKKQNGNRVPIEIVIVGGGSILLNYDFREHTQDIDILVQSMGTIKDVSCRIADQYNLSDDWLNTDFMHTASYSEKLRRVSKHYCSFNNGNVEFRTVTDEYLIAMKMMAAREYRNDVSDIVGILLSMKSEMKDVDQKLIEDAVTYLYGENECRIKKTIREKVFQYVNMSIEELQKEYSALTQIEEQTKQELVEIDEKYQDVVTEKSIDDIIALLRARKKQE